VTLSLQPATRRRRRGFGARNWLSSPAAAPGPRGASRAATADYRDEHAVTRPRSANDSATLTSAASAPDYVKLTSAEDDEQQLVAFLAAAEADAGKLELLS